MENILCQTLATEQQTFQGSLVNRLRDPPNEVIERSRERMDWVPTSVRKQPLHCIWAMAITLFRAHNYTQYLSNGVHIHTEKQAFFFHVKLMLWGVFSILSPILTFTELLFCFSNDSHWGSKDKGDKVPDFEDVMITSAWFIETSTSTKRWLESALWYSVLFQRCRSIWETVYCCTRVRLEKRQ